MQTLGGGADAGRQSRCWSSAQDEPVEDQYRIRARVILGAIRSMQIARAAACVAVSIREAQPVPHQAEVRRTAGQASL